MFVVPENAEELLHLAESNISILTFAFERHLAEDWSPGHSHARGQLFALTKALLVVEAGGERWMFPSQRCAWIPPGFEHSARSVGGAAGSLVFLSAEAWWGLPKKPRLFSSSQLLFAVVRRTLAWSPPQTLSPAQKRLITVLRDEILQPGKESLRLPIPKEKRLAKVAHTLLDDVTDDWALDEWSRFAGMSRCAFMRVFSAQVGMTFGRWRQQARLFAALEMLAEGKSVTEAAVAVGYDSVNVFIEMFRTMMGTTPQRYFRSKQELPSEKM
jgi:AraC-like DNA-binding protein